MPPVLLIPYGGPIDANLRYQPVIVAAKQNRNSPMRSMINPSASRKGDASGFHVDAKYPFQPKGSTLGDDGTIAKMKPLHLSWKNM